MSSNGSPHSPDVDDICCLIDEGERCQNSAANVQWTKKFSKAVGQKRLRISPDLNASHKFICDHHRNVAQSIRLKRRRKDSEDEYELTSSEYQVDFSQIQLNTLRRYKRHYKLQLRPGSTKVQLIEAISNHFRTIRVSEKKIVPLFISMVKSHKSKLDQPKPLEIS
ncbi:histone deacetylase complex subunit SAP30 homolog [Dysidea avara]|uniref:histone deacetylase complex subunit SAP30 homolog n=1 Tax=Dysidea avara TaxID=196820 RepID=UPI0033196AAA